MPDQSYLDDLRLAHMMADNADSLTMSRFKALDLQVAAKPDLTPVSDADTAVEDAVAEAQRLKDRAQSKAAELQQQAQDAFDDAQDLVGGWCGDATSVVEFLRPLRDQLDAPGVLEVCVNRPGELLVETVKGWQTVPAPDMTQERCLSLATAVATYCDQQINQEHPVEAPRRAQRRWGQIRHVVARGLDGPAS